MTTCLVFCRTGRESSIVYCSSRNLTSLPTNLPSDVSVLDFSHNSILLRELPKLCSLQNLSSLSISFNNLHSIEGALENCSKLRQLTLTGNRLKDISNTTFLGLNKLSRLVGLEAEAVSSDSSLNDLDNLNFMDFTFHGFHMPVRFLNKKNIRVLNLTLTNANVLPKQLFGLSGKLHTLRLTGRKIVSMEPEVVKNLPVLRKLLLNLPQAHLPPGFLAHRSGELTLPALKEVKLVGLNSIDAGLLKNQSYLVSLYLDHIADFRGQGFFNDMVRLQKLRITNSNLDNLISTSVFSPLSKLMELSLTGNGLAYLPMDVFANQSRLKLLRLDDNNFTEFPRSVLRLWKTLNSIDLSRNAIQKIPMQYMCCFVRLATADITDNPLVCNCTESRISVCQNINFLGSCIEPASVKGVPLEQLGKSQLCINVSDNSANCKEGKIQALSLSELVVSTSHSIDRQHSSLTGLSVASALSAANNSPSDTPDHEATNYSPSDTPAYEAANYSQNVKPAYEAANYSQSVKSAYEAANYIQSVKPAYEAANYSQSVKPAYEAANYSQTVKPAYEAANYSQSVTPAYEAANYIQSVKPAYEAANYSQSVKPADEAANYSQSVKPAYEAANYSQSVKPAYEAINYRLSITPVTKTANTTSTSVHEGQRIAEEFATSSTGNTTQPIPPFSASTTSIDVEHLFRQGNRTETADNTRTAQGSTIYTTIGPNQSTDRKRNDSATSSGMTSLVNIIIQTDHPGALLDIEESQASNAASTWKASTVKASTGKASTVKASTGKASTDKASTGKASTGKASTGKASTVKAGAENWETETQTVKALEQKPLDEIRNCSLELQQVTAKQVLSSEAGHINVEVGITTTAECVGVTSKSVIGTTNSGNEDPEHVDRTMQAEGTGEHDAEITKPTVDNNYRHLSVTEAPTLKNLRSDITLPRQRTSNRSKLVGRQTYVSEAPSSTNTTLEITSRDKIPAATEKSTGMMCSSKQCMSEDLLNGRTPQDDIPGEGKDTSGQHTTLSKIFTAVSVNGKGTLNGMSPTTEETEAAISTLEYILPKQKTQAQKLAVNVNSSQTPVETSLQENSTSGELPSKMREMKAQKSTQHTDVNQPFVVEDSVLENSTSDVVPSGLVETWTAPTRVKSDSCAKYVTKSTFTVNRSKTIPTMQLKDNILETKDKIDSNQAYVTEVTLSGNRTQYATLSGDRETEAQKSTIKVLSGENKTPIQHDKTTIQHDKTTIQHDKTTIQHDKTTIQHDKTTIQHDKTTIITSQPYATEEFPENGTVEAKEIKASQSVQKNGSSQEHGTQTLVPITRSSEVISSRHTLTVSTVMSPSSEQHAIEATIFQKRMPEVIAMNWKETEAPNSAQKPDISLQPTTEVTVNEKFTTVVMPSELRERETLRPTLKEPSSQQSVSAAQEPVNRTSETIPTKQNDSKGELGDTLSDQYLTEPPVSYLKKTPVPSNKTRQFVESVEDGDSEMPVSRPRTTSIEQNATETIGIKNKRLDTVSTEQRETIDWNPTPVTKTYSGHHFVTVVPVLGNTTTEINQSEERGSETKQSTSRSPDENVRPKLFGNESTVSPITIAITVGNKEETSSPGADIGKGVYASVTLSTRGVDSRDGLVVEPSVKKDNGHVMVSDLDDHTIAIYIISTFSVFLVVGLSVVTFYCVRHCRQRGSYTLPDEEIDMAAVS